MFNFITTSLTERLCSTHIVLSTASLILTFKITESDAEDVKDLHQMTNTDGKDDEEINTKYV